MNLPLVIPRPEVAAIAVISLASSESLPIDLRHAFEDSPEPYRWAMNQLGWGALDGTDWWATVMDLIG